MAESLNCSALSPGLVNDLCFTLFNATLIPADPVCYDEVTLPLGYFDPSTGLCANYTSSSQKLGGLLGSDGTLDLGNTAWVLIASALVMIMTPGVGMFYAGLAGESTASNTLLMSFASLCIVTVQWYLVGYSFAFGPGNAGFGSFAFACLQGVSYTTPSGGYGFGIPHVIFVAFQCMFAQITPALISGAVIGRMKFSSWCIFVLIWTTAIYDPLAHWVWAWDIDPTTGKSFSIGFLGALGSLDFAGGAVIHISSGFAALACAIVLGKRKSYGQGLKPHNVPMVVIGATLLWFGWFGFNAGSAVAANSQASYAFINTHLATACAAISWVFVERIVDKTYSPSGVAAGAVAGLVCITPACGYVLPWGAAIMGFIVSPFCFFAVKLKAKIGVDDTLDSFGIHGVGGVVGAFLTGLFAEPSVAGYTGAFYGKPVQLGYQIAAIMMAASFSFFGTLLLMIILDKTIGVRVSDEVEEMGIDVSEHGGRAYGDSESKKTAVVLDKGPASIDGMVAANPSFSKQG